MGIILCIFKMEIYSYERFFICKFQRIVYLLFEGPLLFSLVFFPSAVVARQVAFQFQCVLLQEPSSKLTCTGRLRKTKKN